MPENNDRINQLLHKLDALLKKQEDFSREINELREEIHQLKTATGDDKPAATAEKFTARPLSKADFEYTEEEIVPTKQQIEQEKKANEALKVTPRTTVAPPKEKSDIEKFIGENLFNKIGVAIIVIGVAIGAKFAIDNQLISPLTRIILGYLVGIGLLGFGIKLKEKYKNYSAVLVSGAIAILYFITYAAHGFYDLIPQLFAFGLMVVFTAFAVVAASHYNKQIIALFGLVGAYAVPFLLSEGSGKVGVLFTYMVIINIGILFIAFKKYWKPLYYSAFVLSWLIYASWLFPSFRVSEHFSLALFFASLFFAIFYGIFLAYKLFQKEKFNTGDIMLLLANSFIFYGLGYFILSSHSIGSQLLGVFTLCNAIVHFGVSVLIYQKELADRNLFYLVSGLVLVFITLAIPVQLDGNWVTLLWAFEAALLFWIGRTNKVPFYEKLSYVLMFIAFYCLIFNWSTVYHSYNISYPENKIVPFFNIHLLTSLLFMAAFGFINYLHHHKKYAVPDFAKKKWITLLSIVIPAILLVVCYCAFQLEVSNYWYQLYEASLIEIDEGQTYPTIYRNEDYRHFQIIWIINYSLLFFSLLSFCNIKWFNNRMLGLINIGLNTFVLLIFLVEGLTALDSLRESYLNPTLTEYYHRDAFNIGIRYVSFAFAGLLLFTIYKYIRQEFLQPIPVNVIIPFDFLLHVTILAVASAELITWMTILKFPQSYNLGLSILWGIYALLLIALGIRQNKKHLRIGAIGLFLLTLVKLFFYDITNLDTIAKTIVFVSLGILLLIISFLYNKYKHLIFEKNENEK